MSKCTNTSYKEDFDFITDLDNNIIFTKEELYNIFRNYIIQGDKYNIFLNSFITDNFPDEYYSISKLLEKTINFRKEFIKKIESLNQKEENYGFNIEYKNNANQLYLKLIHFPMFFTDLLILFTMDLYYLHYLPSDIKNQKIKSYSKSNRKNNLSNWEKKIETSLKNKDITNLYTLNNQWYYSNNNNIIWKYFFKKLYPDTQQYVDSIKFEKTLNDFKYNNLELLKSRLLFTKLYMIKFIQLLISVNHIYQEPFWNNNSDKDNFENFLYHIGIYNHPASNYIFPDINKIISILENKFQFYDNNYNNKTISEDPDEIVYKDIICKNLLDFCYTNTNQNNNCDSHTKLYIKTSNGFELLPHNDENTTDEDIEKKLISSIYMEHLKERTTPENLCQFCSYFHEQTQAYQKANRDYKYCAKLCENTYTQRLNKIKEIFSIGYLNNPTPFYTFLVNQGYLKKIDTLHTENEKKHFFDTFNGYLKQKIVNHLISIMDYSVATLLQYLCKECLIYDKDLYNEAVANKPKYKYDVSKPIHIDIINRIKDCIPNDFKIDENDNLTLEDLNLVIIDQDNSTNTTKSPLNNEEKQIDKIFNDKKKLIDKTAQEDEQKSLLSEAELFKIFVVFLVLTFYNGKIDCLHDLSDYHKCFENFRKYNNIKY